MEDMTFGEAITQARKEKKLSQKEVATATLKEDGESISAQYLNDIEHDRRNPPGESIIRQLARTLDLDADYLFFLAGRFPSDVLELSRDREDISQAMRAFRRNLRGGNR
jgi:transcriptional regulator with XRE-family HTH domain